MRINHIATIKIKLTSEELAKTIYQALEPESDSRVVTSVEESILSIDFRTETLATLRALTNSHLRYIIMINHLSSLWLD